MEEQKKVKNMLFTKSYVVKRLSDSEFDIKKLPIRYASSDKRYWSLLVNKKGSEEHNLIVTCLKEGIAEKRGKFVVSSSKVNAFKIDTISAEVLIQSLNDLCEEVAAQ